MSPKTFIRNNANINFLLPEGLKRAIMALSYVWGDDGRQAHTMRRMAMDYIESMKKDWAENHPEKLTEFNACYENILLAESIRARELEEKLEGLTDEELAE